MSIYIYIAKSSDNSNLVGFVSAIGLDSTTFAISIIMRVIINIIIPVLKSIVQFIFSFTYKYREPLQGSHKHYYLVMTYSLPHTLHFTITYSTPSDKLHNFILSLLQFLHLITLFK